MLSDSNKELSKKIFLVSLPVLLIIEAYGTSQVFDGSLHSTQGFLCGLSFFYYLAYYFTVGILAYFGYSYLKRERANKPSEFLALFYLIVFAFLVDFPRLLFNSPFIVEVAHPAKVYHVLEKGTIQGIPPVKQSIGNAVFFSTLTRITSLPIYYITAYLNPIFLWVLTIFFTYSVARALTNEKFAFLGTLFLLSGFFTPFFSNRVSFATPLYVLIVGVFVKFIKNKGGPSNSAILLLLFPSIVVSHPAHSLFVLIIIAITGLTFYIKERVPMDKISRRSGKVRKNLSKSSHKIGARTKNLILFGIVTWLVWFLLRMNVIPGKNRIYRFFTMLTRGLEFGAIEKGNVLFIKPVYKVFLYMRLTIGPLLLVVPTVLFIYVAYKHPKSWGPDGVPVTNILPAYLLLILAGFIGFQLSTTTALRIYTIALPFSSIFLCLLLESIPVRETLKEVLQKIVPLIIIILMFSVFLVWVPNLTYLGIPSTKESAVKHLNSYSPPDSSIYGIGGGGRKGRFLFSYIYGSRGDLERNFTRLLNPKISFRIIPPQLPNYGYIFLSDKVRRNGTKYSYDPSILERLIFIRTKLDFRFNKIYSNNEFNNIYVL